MNLAIKLAIKNLLGAGLRTVLTVGVLSFAFITILFYKGWIDGWYYQAKKDSIEWEYAQGQLRHQDFDPLDPFTFTNATGVINPLPKGLDPIFVRQASIYPEGRMMGVMLKGISASQQAVKIPSHVFADATDHIPAIIGEGMARKTKLSVGDDMLIRWRDVNGTFDAATVRIVKVFENDVNSVDLGQVYLPIERMWEMTGMQGHASFYLVSEGYDKREIKGWTFNSQEDLLSDFKEMIRSKDAGGLIIQYLLLGIALLAIFDTQVLSVFRRQKEIGTYISLGMTRKQVVGIFTVEGAMNSVFAVIAGAVYGIPLLGYVAKAGIPMPAIYQDSGLPMSERIYPVFTLGLIFTTVVMIVAAATIVSYLPSRKIARMDPVQALKGKIQ